MLVTATLPPESGLLIEAVVADDGVLVVVAATRDAAPCPRRDRPPRRIHSRCRRSAADLPWQGLAVRLIPDRIHRTVGESDLVGWVPVPELLAGRFLLTRPAAHFLGRLLGVVLSHALPQ